MGSTGDPRRCAQPDVLRAGGVLAQARRGAQGRSGHAAGRLPGTVGFVPRAVPAATLALRRLPASEKRSCSLST
jgi:hypothetical protein